MKGTDGWGVVVHGGMSEGDRWMGCGSSWWHE